MKVINFTPSNIPPKLHPAIEQAIHLTQTTSTQDVAKELADNGAPSGLVVVADRQTDGRGQLDRGWESPEGGLYLSIIVRPHNSPDHMPDIPYLSAGIVAKMLKEMYGLKTKVKKPNDTLCLNPKDNTYKKIAGFLTETSIQDNKIKYVILGIGINLNSKMPKSLNATSVYEITGKKINKQEFTSQLIKYLCDSYFTWTSSSVVHQK